MNDVVHTWLWIGTIGMLLGAGLLYLALVNNKSEEDEPDYLSHFFVPLVAFTLYLVMALGYGILQKGDGRLFYYGRYIDWSITTPLLLFSLVTSGLQGTGIKRTGLIVGLLGTDLYMILTGFVAALSNNPTIKWTFFITSCISFIAIYGLLFGPFKKLTATGPHGSTYMKKASALSLVWFAYPVVFLLGQEGIRAWSPGVDAVLFTSLDLIAKVAYGLWAVSLAKKSAVAEHKFSPSVARTAV